MLSVGALNVAEVGKALFSELELVRLEIVEVELTEPDFVLPLVCEAYAVVLLIKEAEDVPALAGKESDVVRVIVMSV